MKVNLKHITELALLSIFIIIFSWIGIGNIFDGTIAHDYPRGMLASDPFHYYNYMESYEQRGIFDYFHYSISYNLSNRIAYQPPLYYVDSVLFGNMAGIENYDAMNLVILFMLISGAILMYYVLKRLNWQVAILSLPLAIFIFAPNFIFGILWGRQPTMFTEVFLIGLFWILPCLDKKYCWLLVGLFLAGLALGHIPQLLFGVAYIAAYYGYKFIREKTVSKKSVRGLIKAFVLFTIISLYYLIRFKNTIGKVANFRFEKLTAAMAVGNRYASLTDFRFVAVILIMGAILFFFLKNKKPLLPVMFMFLVGFTNFFLGKRGIETRFMWPIFLGGFFGLTLYYGIIALKKQKSLVVISLVFLLASGLLIKGYYEPNLGKGSLANKYNWEALTFISKNTPERSTIFFGYGDSYDQKAFLGQAKRLSYAVSLKDWTDTSKTGELKEYYETTLFGEGQDKAAYYGEEGKVGFYLDEFKPTVVRDTCSYNYYVFDKFGGNKQLIEYNLIVANQLVANEHIKVVFENELVIILENEGTSKECMAGGDLA